MNRLIASLMGFLLLSGCNLSLTSFTFIYNNEGPNKQIAEKMEQLIESTFYNVDIVLVEGVGTEQNLDSLVAGNVDIALVENYVNYREGINSIFSVYEEVLHIFYDSGLEVSNFYELIYDHDVYIGLQESPTFNLMIDLFEFYGLDLQRISLVAEMDKAEVFVLLTNLMTENQLNAFSDFQLFSFDTVDNIGSASVVEGIALKHPRLSPFIIPSGAYGRFTQQPIVTLSVDLIMMTRAGMGELAINDFTKTMLQNRQIFTPIDPLLYGGMKEDFNQDKLNIPLHEGARVYLARDEPTFLERYAELGGVILSLVVAVASGLISLIKWQAQRKKDKIDEFYEDLINIKNNIVPLKSIREVVDRIKRVQNAQNKAFELLISEELVANDSFRIYMELSKETINELRTKLRSLKAQA